jgi:uncharacterized membrane protein
LEVDSAEMGRSGKPQDSIDLHVGQTLLAALLLSLTVMVTGVVVEAVKGQRATAKIIPLDHLFHQLSKGNASALLDTGIVLLFAAPLMGVLVACLEFVRQRDIRFALVTGLLLVILMGSFAVALR